MPALHTAPYSSPAGSLHAAEWIKVPAQHTSILSIHAASEMGALCTRGSEQLVYVTTLATGQWQCTVYRSKEGGIQYNVCTLSCAGNVGTVVLVLQKCWYLYPYKYWWFLVPVLVLQIFGFDLRALKPCLKLAAEGRHWEQAAEATFFFIVDGLLAVPPPFFARCPIFRNQSSHFENQTEPASQIPEEGWSTQSLERKGVPGFGIKRAPSREGVSAVDHQATPAAPDFSQY